MILFLNAAQTMNSPPRLSSDSMVMRFPARLWRIVNSCTSGAISWGPNGKTVRVLRHKFEKEYLLAVSKPFKTSKFESFVRQLNHYGFKKITNPIMLDESKEEAASLSEYRNSLFTRDRPEMIAFLHRSCRRSGPEKGARRQRPKPREATLCPQSSSQPAGFNAEPSSNNSSILLHPLLRPDKPADFNNCKSNCSVGAQPGPTCSVLNYMLPKGEHKIQGLTVLRDLSSYAFRSAKEENVQRQVLSFMDTDQSNGPAPGNVTSNQVIIGSKESTPSLAPLLPSSPPQQQLDMVVDTRVSLTCSDRQILEISLTEVT
ncbi:uncharacterized protein LOC112577055 [Pomacea canaliculata]|uniref:uncharacterized protein LOC112577055 n=1 Tax=Pomacea canaliculata TaxID=400727 RepID=UPI000D72FEA9|nr:uncharacterized protein LOC112577055 [Pomacea canaliculata]